MQDIGDIFHNFALIIAISASLDHILFYSDLRFNGLVDLVVFTFRSWRLHLGPLR